MYIPAYVLSQAWLNKTVETNIISGLILGLHQANVRQRYFVTTSLIGWAQA